MKIKTKKQFTLPQLIEWAFENNVRNQSFLTYDSEEITSEVHFDIRGLPKFSSMADKEDIFEVEVEEEITEDTEISKLAHYSVFGFKTTKSNASINEEKSGNSIAFYIMNNDLTMTLIWTQDKGLVE